MRGCYPCYRRVCAASIHESEVGMSPRRRASLSASVAALIGGAIMALSSGAAAQNKGDRMPAKGSAQSAPGNGDGADLHLFRPAVDSKGFFTVNGADILGHLDFSLGLVLDYGYGLMPLNKGHGKDATHETDYMVRHGFTGTFQVDLGLFSWVVVGISAPVVLFGGDAATDIGPTGATYNDDNMDLQAFGNLAAHVKVRILRPEGPIGLAVVAQAGYGVTGARNFGAE